MTHIGLFKKNNIHYMILFSLCNAFIGYVFAYEIDLFPKAFRKFYFQFTIGSRNDADMLMVWGATQHKRLERRYPKIFAR